MTWDFCIEQYLEHFCIPEGLSSKTVAAYRAALEQFKTFVGTHLGGARPEDLRVVDVLAYVEHLREVRKNQNGAVNRAVVIIKNLYAAMVAMRYMEPRDNPMRCMPKMKAVRRKFKDTLSEEEVWRLLDQPRKDTVMGLRDRAILALFYCTGIRVSECANLREKDVRIEGRLIKVVGKGGDERTVPLNDEVKCVLEAYQKVRGPLKGEAAFFRSRRGGGMARNSIFMMVKRMARLAKIEKNVSPHVLRHTFATLLVRQGENIVVVQKLLGHRLLSSTEIYLHMTAVDLRKAIDRHPIRKMSRMLMDLIPGLQRRFQHPPGTKFAFERK